jgi:hypothetical protein
MFQQLRNRQQRKKFAKYVNKTNYSGRFSSVQFFNELGEMVDAGFFDVINNDNMIRDSFAYLLGSCQFSNLYRLVGCEIRILLNHSCEESTRKYKFDMFAGDFVYRDIDTNDVVISEKDFI